MKQSIWTIKHPIGSSTLYNAGTCEVSYTAKSLILSNIKSERIRPKKEGGKVNISREWSPEVKDEDIEKGEFTLYYQKQGIPYIFKKCL